MKFSASWNGLKLTEPEARITSGSAGTVTAEFTFDNSWEGYDKTAVFRCGDTSREVLLPESGVCAVPWETLLPGRRLRVGVYGSKAEKRLPTIYADAGYIERGAEPSETAKEPTGTVYEQLLERIKALEAPAQGGGVWEEVCTITPEAATSNIHAQLGADYRKVIVVINAGDLPITANRTIKWVFNDYDSNVFDNNLMAQSKPAIGCYLEISDLFVYAKAVRPMLSASLNAQMFGAGNATKDVIINKTAVVNAGDSGIRSIHLSTLSTFAFQAGEQIRIYGVRA